MASKRNTGERMPDITRADIKEIAAALTISPSQANRRASRETWRYDEDILPTGNKCRMYPLAGLPSSVYDAVLIHRSEGALRAAPVAESSGGEAYRPTRSAAWKAAPTLGERGRRRMDSRLEIMSAFDRFSRGAKEISVARERFVQAYGQRLIDCPAWVYETVPHISTPSLKRWDAPRKAGTPEKLSGKYGNRKDTGVFARHEKLADWIVAYITKKPQAHVTEVFKAAVATFGQTVETVDQKTGEIFQKPLPSQRGFQRFIAQWKADHPALFAYATDPDGYRNKYEYAAGEMYKNIIRRNQLWEIDASPSDVMCTDGRYSIYACVDIHSRWGRVRVTKTPKSLAALLLIRDCILGWRGRPETAWGMAEKLKTDNGSDFKSQHFMDTIRRLGIEQDVCAPYSPKQKAAVERFIGTVQQQFMEMQPGYVGHSVTDRRKIESRKAFSQRLGQDDADIFSVALTAAELQERLNEWTETVYARQPHDGLDGKTPFEVRAAYCGAVSMIQGVGVLEMLLAEPADKGGARTVTKKGIKIGKIDYYHADLMPGETVHVRMDPDDLGRVYVYRGNPWEFVGIAVNPEREGISRAAVAAEVKARQKQNLSEAMRQIRRDQREINTRTISLDIIRDAQKHSSSVTAFPPKSSPYSTPDMEAAQGAADARERASNPPPVQALSPEALASVEARRAEIAAELASPKVAVLPESPKQRFTRFWKLQQRIEAGEALPPEDARQLLVYVGTPEYRAHTKLLKDFGPDFLQA
jgi:transposase InsO family protein